MHSLRKINIELIVWVIALLVLGFMDVNGQTPSLCLLKGMGISGCPGCGLGHSIHYLLHGDWQAAIHSHILGPLVLGTLIYRILQLSRQQFASIKQCTYE